ncbi:hypothetical protein ACLOJK_007151 [Asimina triloba]
MYTARAASLVCCRSTKSSALSYSHKGSHGCRCNHLQRRRNRRIQAIQKVGSEAVFQIHLDRKPSPPSSAGSSGGCGRHIFVSGDGEIWRAPIHDSCLLSPSNGQNEQSSPAADHGSVRLLLHHLRQLDSDLATPTFFVEQSGSHTHPRPTIRLQQPPNPKSSPSPSSPNQQIILIFLIPFPTHSQHPDPANSFSITCQGQQPRATFNRGRGR